MKLKAKLLIVLLCFCSFFLGILSTLYFKNNEQYYSLLNSLSREDRKRLEKIEVFYDAETNVIYYFNDGAHTSERLVETSENTFTK